VTKIERENKRENKIARRKMLDLSEAIFARKAERDGSGADQEPAEPNRRERRGKLEIASRTMGGGG
jgi:hypothetical protein